MPASTARAIAPAPPPASGGSSGGQPPVSGNGTRRRRGGPRRSTVAEETDADAATVRPWTGGTNDSNPPATRSAGATAGKEAWLLPFTQAPPGAPPLPFLNSALRLPEGDLSLERLFVAMPRTISFAHRPLLSLRHPYLRHAMESDPPRGSQTTRRGRTLRNMDSVYCTVEPQTKAQRLQCLNREWMTEEERKWADLGHLFDVVALEGEILTRRHELLRSVGFLRGTEQLWAALVPPREEMMTREAYHRFNTTAWNMLVTPLAKDDATGSPRHLQRELQRPMQQSTAGDFILDSQGKDGVSFENFQLSLFELADNWVDAVSAAPFGEWVQKLVRAITTVDSPSSRVAGRKDGVSSTSGTPQMVPQTTPAEPQPEAESWDAKRRTIVANYHKGLFDSGQRGLCGLRRRPNSAIVEYYMTPIAELLKQEKRASTSKSGTAVAAEHSTAAVNTDEE